MPLTLQNLAVATVRRTTFAGGRLQGVGETPPPPCFRMAQRRGIFAGQREQLLLRRNWYWSVGIPDTEQWSSTSSQSIHSNPFERYSHTTSLVRCHLEDAAVAPLADQRVAVGEALRARDVRAEEVEQRLVGILPDDLAGARIDLDHARECRRMIVPVRAVVEDQEVAVRQRPRVVLLRQRRAAEFPDDRPRWRARS